MLAADDMQTPTTETCTSVKKEEPARTKKHDEMQYLDLIQYILDNGAKKEDRTGEIKILQRCSYLSCGILLCVEAWWYTVVFSA